MIRFALTFVIRTGHEDEAVAYFRLLSSLTRLEPGCRVYSAHRSPADPRKFFLYEQYDDQAAIDAHCAAPYFLDHAVNGLFAIAASRSVGFHDPLGTAHP